MRASRTLFVGLLAAGALGAFDVEAAPIPPRSRSDTQSDSAPGPSVPSSSAPPTPASGASGTPTTPGPTPPGSTPDSAGPPHNAGPSPSRTKAQPMAAASGSATTLRADPHDESTGGQSGSDQDTTVKLPIGSNAHQVPFVEFGQHFVLDPVADGTITVLGFGLSGLLGWVLSTGEIKPPPPAVNSGGLLPIDRIAVTQKVDPNAGTYSYIGLYAAIGYAGVDTVLSGFRDGWDAAVVDGFMYAESTSLTLALTNFTKIAVRRPRPIDYQNCAPQPNGALNPNPACASTDLGLSFFSGHAAMTASIGATATYLAFVRSPHSWRPWVTLAGAVLLTTFVSYERVRSGEHFPTDVMAGSLAGAGIGILVPHFHRHKTEPPVVWVGFAPTPHGGATAALNGSF